MDEFTKFNNQTAGRDKLFRLVQYTSRILWYNLEKRGSKRLHVDRVKRVDEVLGLMRRLLRFGRFFETLHSALPVISSVTNPVIRFTSAMSRVSNGCFMFIDHIVCLNKLGILPSKLIDAAKWDKMSLKFWLYAILLGLIRDAYEIMKIYREEYQNRLKLNRKRRVSSNLAVSGGSEIVNEANKVEMEVKRSTEAEYGHGQQSMVRCLGGIGSASHCVLDHADVAVDTAKNLFDLFIPLNGLGFLKLNPALVSFLGVLSTILSAIPQINPMVKMVPAT